MTSPHRPPSCDLLTPKLNDCPLCGGKAERHKRLLMIKCVNNKCNLYGPNDDPYGHKWNSIPRRSEVEELLRLVDEVTSWKDDVEVWQWLAKMDKQISENIVELAKHADRMRKEWGYE